MNVLCSIMKIMNKRKTAYGVILYHKDGSTGGVWFLCMKRRCTYAYFAILQGRFTNDKELKALASDLTNDEMEKLLHLPFSHLWRDAFFDAHLPPHALPMSMKYAITRIKLAYMSRHIRCGNRQMYDLPKGRSQRDEDPITTAFRELREETGVSINNDEIPSLTSDKDPLKMKFTLKRHDGSFYTCDFYLIETEKMYSPPLMYSLESVGGVWIYMNKKSSSGLSSLHHSKRIFLQKAYRKIDEQHNIQAVQLGRT